MTDQTPGYRKQGTPAISDAWMTPWMEYLYMDQPYPTNATGVPVSIDAVDPNGNYVHIGNATSDISWHVQLHMDTSEHSRQIHYYRYFQRRQFLLWFIRRNCSSRRISLQLLSHQQPTPTSVADMYFVPAIAGLFVLIIIVAIVLALLMLRKRP